MSGDYTQRTRKALVDLNIYNYMVVYIVVRKVMKNLLKFLGQKIYI